MQIRPTPCKTMSTTWWRWAANMCWSPACRPTRPSRAWATASCAPIPCLAKTAWCATMNGSTCPAFSTAPAVPCRQRPRPCWHWPTTKTTCRKPSWRRRNSPLAHWRMRGATAWASWCQTVYSSAPAEHRTKTHIDNDIIQGTIMTTTSQNDILFARAQKTTPGGVNSPVRAFRSVGGTPRFITRAEGPYFWDADGKRYIDYIGSWGPAIVGHAHPEVVKAVQDAAALGLSFGAPTEGEVLMAEEITRLVPSIEQVRLVSSGTEATMSALRLARGATGRDKIVKFEGCYHGHADSLLVKAGSGLLTFGNPTSAGVPEDFVKHTLVLDYNDVAQIEEAFANFGSEIACVIVEPVAGNMNLIKASPEFLAALRALCTQHGALLIFDEVMCGFRVRLGGAQELYGIEPDLTALGKVIGGGLPVAAFGGSAALMNHMAPLGAVYQAGTLSGNPIAVAAGMTTLKLIQQPGFYDKLSATADRLADGLMEAAREAGVTFCADYEGGMFGLYFSEQPPSNYAQMMAGDRARFNTFFHAMLDEGVYFAPAAFEAGFVSAAHDDAIIDATIDAARKVFRAMKAEA